MKLNMKKPSTQGNKKKQANEMQGNSDFLHFKQEKFFGVMLLKTEISFLI